jgi:Tir chaperone protein (CesT) family
MATIVSKTIDTYMSRHRLPASALREDGRLTLLIDDKYRVHLYPGLEGSVVLVARIASLPLEREERDRMVDRALRLAGTRLQQFVEGISTDRHAEALWLQQTVPLGADAAVDSLVADFVNALALWIAAMRRQS